MAVVLIGGFELFLCDALRSDVSELVEEIVEREPLVKQRAEQLQKLVSSKKSG